MLFLIPGLLSCAHNDNKARSENLIKKEVLDVAIKYARDKFKEPKETVAKDGIVTVVEKQVNYVTSNAYQIRYVIDPSKIVIGLIDDDENEDAIITISLFNGYTEMPESLILIKTDGKMVLNRSIEADMRIIGIKDRVITAEVFTRSRNSPLRNCSSCKEVVKYKYRMGDLVRIE
jgi:hypothetical protein